MKLGYSVETIQALGMQGRSNGEVAELSLKQNFILITFDSDFTVLRKDLQDKLRIIYIKIHPRDPKVACDLLEQYLEECLKKLIVPNTIELTLTGIN